MICKVHTHKLWVIYCFFFIAVILQTCPIFPIVWYFRPNWVMILLVYWVIKVPEKVNIGTGFILGLIVDILSNSVLGVYSLSLSVIAYLIMKNFYFLKYISIWQQSLVIIFFSLIDQIIRSLIKYSIIKIPYSFHFFYDCVLDGIIWFFLMLLMRKTFKY